jgi:hypothetical protein
MVQDPKVLAEVEEMRKKLDKIAPKQGFTNKRDDEGTYIPKEKRAPYRPEYKYMSKKDVVEAERKRRENDIKAEAYRKELDSQKPVVEEEQEVTESVVIEKAKKKKK